MNEPKEVGMRAQPIANDNLDADIERRVELLKQAMAQNLEPSPACPKQSSPPPTSQKS